MLWILALIGAVIGLLGFTASLEQAPARTETVVFTELEETVLIDDFEEEEFDE